MLAIVVTALEETRTVVWNLVAYLIVKWNLGESSPARVALVVGGALLCMIVPYLLGSVNPAVIISKIFYREDVRNHGSGNAGSTNMLRTYGKKAAVATLLCDLAKAAAAYWFGFAMLGINGAAIAGFFVVFGHMFPVFHRFRGGKGVACLAAVVLCTSPLTFAILLGIWLIIALGTRFVSLASVMAALLYPLILRAFTGASAGLSVAMAVLSAVFVVFRHKENLKRLYHGTETKLRLSRKKPQKGESEKGDDDPS